MSRALNRTTEPTTTPVELDAAKLHARVISDAEDTLLEGYLAAASDRVERYTCRSLITQTWTLKIDSFEDPDVYEGGAIIVPRPPLASVTSITYVDTDEDTQTLSTDVYAVDTSSHPGRIYLKPSQSWPSLYDKRHAVTITYVAGYGASGADVPAGLMHAMRLLFSHYYENREPIVIGKVATRIPEAIASLLENYRIWETA